MSSRSPRGRDPAFPKLLPAERKQSLRPAGGSPAALCGGGVPRAVPRRVPHRQRRARRARLLHHPLLRVARGRACWPTVRLVVVAVWCGALWRGMVVVVVVVVVVAV